MIQVFAMLGDGRFLSGPVRPEEIEEPCQISWLDIQDPTPEELAWLGRKYHFHPLALEDCAHFDQRAKLEEYADHLFIVLHGIRPGANRVELYELHCFLAQNVVVTVHQGEIPALKSLCAHVASDRTQLPAQADYLLHRVLDAVMDANPSALEGLEGRIERLDEEVFMHRVAEQVLGRIHTLMARVNELRHTLNPEREIFEMILSREYSLISRGSLAYFRDVYDHLIRLSMEIEAYRDRLASIRDAQLSVAAYRSNETMKRLTLITVIFLPITFLTGFFGMNFRHIPFNQDGLFWAVCAAMIVLPISMLLWFNRRNWM